MVERIDIAHVIDGDTFDTEIQHDRIRLADVDAPEAGEPGGDEATEKLRELIEFKEVSIIEVDRDIYNRTVAEVRVGGLSVNAAMRDFLRQQRGL